MDFDTAHKELNDRMDRFTEFVASAGIVRPACVTLGCGFELSMGRSRDTGWRLALAPIKNPVVDVSRSVLAKDASIELKAEIVKALPQLAKVMRYAKEQDTKSAMDAIVAFDASDIAKEMAQG